MASRITKQVARGLGHISEIVMAYMNDHWDERPEDVQIDIGAAMAWLEERAEMPFPTYTDWHEVPNETFRFLATVFSINVAKRILQKCPHKLWSAPIKPLLNVLGVVYIDEERLANDATIDLSVPLIVATLEGGSRLVIDGWHRIAKANREGVENLPCVILTLAETKKVMGR